MLILNTGGVDFSDKDITLAIRRVGQEHCDPKKRHERRQWDTYDSLHFVLYGRGTLIANGEKISLAKGDAFLLYTNEAYEYYPDPVDPWSYIWIDFHTNDTEALFARCGLSPAKPVVHVADFSATMGLLKAIYEAYDASEMQETVCSAYFLLLLSELMKNYSRNHAAGEYSSVKQRHIRNILTYINNNYRLPLTVQEIATNNHISVSRMMALFAEIVGMSPISYLNKFRISAACDLLRKTNAPIGEIASAVGVEDQLYFSRIFKKAKGMSPREYRAKGIDENTYEWLKERGIDFR